MAVSESVAGWSKTAADNNTADTGINWSEGQAPSTVNNSARGMMAAIANWYDDTGGQLTLAGGTTAYTLTTNQGLDTAYADGDRIHAVVNAANTAAATLNVDSIGAKAIRKIAFTGSTPNDVALDVNDLVIDQHALFEYDASANAAAGAWILLNPMGLATRVVTIASGSIAAAATQAITDIPATYRALQLVIAGASSDTATRKVQVRISTNNGSSYISTGYGGVSDDGVTPTQLGGIFASQASTMGSGGSVSMNVYIPLYQGGVYPQCHFAGVDAAGVAFGGTGTYTGGTSAVDALQILWNGSGNFDAGTYALYGIR